MARERTSPKISPFSLQRQKDLLEFFMLVSAQTDSWIRGALEQLRHDLLSASELDPSDDPPLRLARSDE